MRTPTSWLRLLPALVIAAVALVGCGDDDPATTPTPGTTPPGAPATTPDGLDTDTPMPPASPTDAPTDPSPTDTALDDVSDRPVTLTLDGEVVPLARTCSGVDGAVLATTEGEVTVSLIREEGLAMRYEGEGMTAETDEVTEEPSAGAVTYSATLGSDDVDPPVAVTMTITPEAENLEDC